MLRFISASVLALVVAATAASPAEAGRQTLRCLGGSTGTATIDHPQGLQFVVTVTNPLKVRNPATSKFVYSHRVVPSGANVAVRYPTGSHNRAVLAFATKNFTLAEPLLPGRNRQFQSPSWQGDCTAVATW